MQSTKASQTTKYVKSILLAVNSTENIFKYPIGNKELTDTLKMLESKERVKFDSMKGKWVMKNG